MILPHQVSVQFLVKHTAYEPDGISRFEFLIDKWNANKYVNFLACYQVKYERTARKLRGS